MMPEAIHSPGATFPHDRLDDVRVFAHRLAEAAGTDVKREGKAVIEHSIKGRSLPDVHQAANVYRGVRWALGSDKLNDLPLEILVAIGEGAKGIVHLTNGRSVEGHAALEAAIETLAGYKVTEADLDASGIPGARIEIAVAYARTHLAHMHFQNELDEHDRFALEGI